MFYNSFRNFPAFAKIIEVAPRDGLQNEKACLSIANKIRLIKKLEDCGLSHIEVGSIVNPKLVPQMANSSDLVNFLNNKNSTYSFLTPSIKGYSQIVNKKNVFDLNSQVNEIVLFTAASETFNQKNINCSIKESFERFKPIIQQAQKDKIRIRGSISCSLGCPYEGIVSPNKVVDIINRYFDLNVDLIDIADTIGVGTSKDISKILDEASKNIPMKYLTGHFHDTNYKALDLVHTCLNYGINTFHSSIGGIGGCPFSPTRAGNLSTEHLVEYLHSIGIHTGINLNKLKSTSSWTSDLITGRTSDKKN
jgi:hydroxymethylglutaryl-CoA lyase